MRHKLTSLLIVFSLIVTLFAGAQAVYAEEGDNTGGTNTETEVTEGEGEGAEEPEVVVPENGWDENKTHYYKNGKPVTGLKKISGKYYFFRDNGAVLKNRKKTVAVGSKKYMFYFGKTGAAYKAVANKYAVECKTYKPGSYTYGFDTKSHIVTGAWVSSAGKAWIFRSNGRVNLTKTRKLRRQTRYGRKSKSLLKNVRRILGKPKRTVITKNSCNFFDNDPYARYWDYTLRYKNVQVEMTKNTRTGVYYMNGIYGRNK